MIDEVSLSEELLHILSKSGYTSPLPYVKELIPLIKEETLSLESLKRRLKTNEPIQYIIGYEYFLGRKFAVNNSVLIPRIETEILVSKVRGILVADSISKYDLLDIGTGSGAIGISILLENPKLPINATFIDIDEDALKVCKANAHQLLGDSNVHFLKSDLLNEYKVPDSIECAVICANLPYINAEDIKILDDSVIMHEPIVALDGGIDGMELIDNLLLQINELDGYSTIYLFLEGDESFKPKILKSIKGKLPNWDLQRLSIFADQFDVERFAYIKIIKGTK